MGASGLLAGWQAQLEQVDAYRAKTRQSAGTIRAEVSGGGEMAGTGRGAPRSEVDSSVNKLYNEIGA